MPGLPTKSLVIVKYKFFKLSSDLMLLTWSNSHMAFRIGVSYWKSAPCLVWWPRVFYRGRYNVFIFSRDLTWPPDWGLMRIYGWKFLVFCHHPGKSCDHNQCNSGDIILSIFTWPLVNTCLKGLYEFAGGSPSGRVTTLPCLVTIGQVQVEI